MKIYHIITPRDWEESTDEGQLRTSTLEKEGFIHCCKENQIRFVVNNWFSGRDELLVITIDADKLESPLVFENSEAGEESFPHVYGPINLDAVVDIQPWNKEGR